MIQRNLVMKPVQLLKVKGLFKSQRRFLKLAQFTYPREPCEVRLGLVNGNNIIDLNKIDHSLPTTMIGLLNSDDYYKVEDISSLNPPSMPLTTIDLMAPIHGMDKIIGMAVNYADYCRQYRMTQPDIPVFFSKFSSTVIGHKQCVRIKTDMTQCVDFEVELTLVIKKVASNVMAHQAHDYIFGYTVAQDISARDWQKQRNGGQFLLGKSMDTFCPIGPWIVTSDEVGDAGNLDISCSLNGELMQNSNTSQLINKIPDVIQRLTSVMTLLPGDIILTGTPGGVGMYRNPPRYLRPGDVLESSVQRIGALVTRVTDCSC